LKKQINILDNENTKIKSNITEIKNDVEIKNKLFLNSIKFLKFDLENILIKHNKYIQYIYYYFGNKKEDNEYFKFFIATNKLYDYFYDVNNINEHFFSKSFKEFIHKINLKN
jgi:predicted Zn-dependent protease